MTIAPKITVTKTTEADINADEKTFQYPCDICHRRFDTTRGVAIHKSKNNCDISGAADVKPRRNQRANKIIEAKKRAVIVGTQDKIKLNELITNVEIFKYLGAKTTSYGSDEEEVEARILHLLTYLLLTYPSRGIAGK